MPNETQKLNIVNRHLQFPKVSLVEQTGHYYLQIAAEIDKSPFPFFLTTSKKKKQLIKQCKLFCELIGQQAGVVSAVVFKARLIPPGRGKFILERKGKIQVARYDVALLIEAKTAQAIEAVKISDAFCQMEVLIRKAAINTHIVTATNVKHISPVDHNRQGVFLFNYFFADDLQQNLSVWEYTAGWFQQETGLDNSTVLLPVNQQDSKYTIINHCRWNKLTDVLPSLIFKKSFHSYVLDNFYANNVAAMPILYKMA